MIQRGDITKAGQQAYKGQAVLAQSDEESFRLALSFTSIYPSHL
jgi:hypothetical protein